MEMALEGSCLRLQAIYRDIEFSIEANGLSSLTTSFGLTLPLLFLSELIYESRAFGTNTVNLGRHTPSHLKIFALLWA